LMANIKLEQRADSILSDHYEG